MLSLWLQLRELTESTLSFWTLFWTLRVPLGSWTQFDLHITTTWVLPTSYPKIIILALLLTEILRLFGILFRVFYYRYDMELWNY